MIQSKIWIVASLFVLLTTFEKSYFENFTNPSIPESISNSRNEIRSSDNLKSKFRLNENEFIQVVRNDEEKEITSFFSLNISDFSISRMLHLQNASCSVNKIMKIYIRLYVYFCCWKGLIS